MYIALRRDEVTPRGLKRQNAICRLRPPRGRLSLVSRLRGRHRANGGPQKTVSIEGSLPVALAGCSRGTRSRRASRWEAGHVTLKGPRCTVDTGLVAMFTNRGWVRAAAWSVALLFVAAGCATTNYGDNYAAPVSISDCISAWNHGDVTLDPNAYESPSRPVREVGMIAPRVWVRGCGMVFDLGQGRVFVLDTSSVRNSSDARSGLGFFPDTEDQSVGIFTAAQIGVDDTTVPWNACQFPDGTIRLGACPPSSATWKRLDVLKVERGYARRMIAEAQYPRNTWWLGVTFQGIPASRSFQSRPHGEQEIRITGANAVAYVVADQHRVWQLRVVTIPRRVERIQPCSAAWRTYSCLGGVQSRELLVLTHPTAQTTVAVVSTQAIPSSKATLLNPPPADITDQIRQALQTMPRSMTRGH